MKLKIKIIFITSVISISFPMLTFAYESLYEAKTHQTQPKLKTAAKHSSATTHKSATISTTTPKSATTPSTTSATTKQRLALTRADLPTANDQMNYILGYELQNILSANGYVFKPNLMLAGYQDAVHGRKSIFTEEEKMQMIQQVQAKILARHEGILRAKLNNH